MAQLINTGRDRWQVVIDLKGVRKKKTIRGSKAQAAEWARTAETEITTNGALPVDVVGTVGELVEGYEKDMAANGVHWSHTKTYNLFKIREQIGAKTLTAFTKHDVIAYGKLLAKMGRGPNGVKERLNYLSKAFKWGKKHKDFPLAPQIDAIADAISVLTDLRMAGDGQARTRKLSEAEIDQVKAQTLKRRSSTIDMAAIIDVLRILPFRVGELCQIEWANLDPIERSVKIKRKHPTDPNFVQIVALPVIGGVDTYELIAGRDRQLVQPFPYSSKTVSTTFWLAARMAAVENFHLHDLRAHAITWLRLNGIDKGVAKAMMGHSKDSKVLDEVYTRISPRHVHDAIKEAGVDIKMRPKTGQVVQLRA